MRTLIVTFLSLLLTLALVIPAHAENPPVWLVSRDYKDGKVTVHASKSEFPGSNQKNNDSAPASNSGGGVLVVSPGPSVGELVVGYQRMLGLMAYDSCAAIDVDRPTVQCVQDGQVVEIYNPLYTNPDVSGLPAVLTEEATAAVVQEVVAQLGLPKPDVIIGPDPANNEWNALAIGLPVWMRNSNIDPVTTSVNQAGIDISITATPVQHVFDMGNNDQITCTTMAINPGRFDGYIPPASPDCGYTYLDETGDYTITSTTTYDISWTAAGYTGNLQATTTGTNQLKIIELHTVVVG